MAGAALAVLLTASPAAADTPVVGGTSFNDATPVISGAYSDVVDTGTTVYYGVRLGVGQRLTATATLDMSGIDPTRAQTSQLLLSLYDSLHEEAGGTEAVGPGDPTTHLKSTTAEIGPVRRAGFYYVSAGVDDETETPTQVPLGLNVRVAAASAPSARGPHAASTRGSGTSWAVFAALCAGGLVLGGAGGLLFRRR